MTDYKIYTPSLFENHLKFPWDVLGYGVPKYGQVHSYVASILAPHANRYEKPLLQGRPALFEIKRLADVIRDAQDQGHVKLSDSDAPFVCGDIFKECTPIYDTEKRYRPDLAQEVLNVLRRFDFYKLWVHGRLDYLWKQNLITIPREHLVPIVESKVDENHYRMW